MLTLLFAGPLQLRLIFGGDIMLNGVQPTPNYFRELAPLLHSGISFANLEVPLTNSRTPTVTKSPAELKARTQFVLKALPTHAKLLASAGIKFVSLGNNHCMDYGPRGLAEMEAGLDAAGIASSGAGRNLARARKVTFLAETPGLRVGMISALAFMTHRALLKDTPATECSAGVNTIDISGAFTPKSLGSLRDWIALGHRHCDVLVVAVHWGTERKSIPNSYQVRLGRALVDCGADLVWGNHPHVVQGIELYRGVPILYSMGNLFSALPARTGLLAITYHGTRRNIRFLPCQIKNGKTSLLSSRLAAAAKTDFQKICEAIQTKYPNPNSTSPFRIGETSH